MFRLQQILRYTGSAKNPKKKIEIPGKSRGGIEMEGTKRPFPEESRLYTGSIFRPLLDTKTRIGSQGYVLSDDMVSSSFFSPATCIYLDI